MASASEKKFVYLFGNGIAEGESSMNALLGGKGANLAEMTRMGVPVPPGFTISTDVCRFYFEHGTLPDGLTAEVMEALHCLEQATGHQFGDPQDPLLVSVRSGAPISMPGMMDTILNVGLNDQSTLGLANKSSSLRFALDSYRRLLQMFGTVVLEMPKKSFAAVDESQAIAGDEERAAAEVHLQGVVAQYQALYKQYTGRTFPQDPMVQLDLAIRAVFDSWKSERASFYRKMNGISDQMGTAVTVQTMVFGNRGEDSGTGVGFTRNPSNGAREIFAEFLNNAQGEDIVAGTRTPLSISRLQELMPEVYAELLEVTTRLEQHYRDVQDFEFTVEQGKLYLLQTRSAKRTAEAAVRIAVDMAEEGLLSRKEAVSRVSPVSLSEVLSPQLDLASTDPVLLTQGLPASSGAAVGCIALSSAKAISMSQDGTPVILVTEETTADDIQGMAASEGFVTARGGATSHAAVVARGMGKCCITGAQKIHIDASTNSLQIESTVLQEGDWLSVDGSTGKIYLGRLKRQEKAENNRWMDALLKWSVQEGVCKVRANADTPADAAQARHSGAVGIGLCRTEHMFFDPARLKHVRSMVLATTREDRVRALDLLLPMQQADFEELFRTMAPLPVTIRLLDPPLHEFLPDPGEITEQLGHARATEEWDRCMELEIMRKRVHSLAEVNPMMGHRGCRLSLTYPEILEMQVRAVLQAAVAVRKEGLDPCPEIMVPLVASEREMSKLAELIRQTAHTLEEEFGQSIPFRIGTMIELPRAALCAGPISRHVEFLSFGTNDLTQMTYGFSRDDSSRYLDSYLAQGLLDCDPFMSIDREGVGSLIRTAMDSARAANPSIKIGVCGEHGGDPRSIEFFCELGVDYVSCSPARIPIAQLAAAQAAA